MLIQRPALCDEIRSLHSAIDRGVAAHFLAPNCGDLHHATVISRSKQPRSGATSGWIGTERVYGSPEAAANDSLKPSACPGTYLP